MIIDATEIELTPGGNGMKCLGNGAHLDENNKPIECCCNECSFALDCLTGFDFPVKSQNPLKALKE